MMQHHQQQNPILRPYHSKLATLHADMNRTGYRTVDGERARLVRDERDSGHLSWSYRFYVAVEVAVDLEAVRLRICVTHNELHGIPLVDRDYRPSIRRRPVGNAIVEARAARDDEVSAAGHLASRRQILRR